MDLDRFQLLYDWGVDNASLSRNPNLTPEQIDLLYTEKNGSRNRPNLARFSKLTNEQFMRFFNDKDFDKNYLTPNPHLTPEQIDLLYDVRDKENLAEYSKLTEEQFMRFFNDGDFDKNYLASNRNLTTEQIDLLYQTKGVDKYYLSQFPKLTEEQFIRFFNIYLLYT